METFVTLLRAVNVGGRSLPMDELRRVLAGLGFSGVQTYLQSGNAVFQADGGEPHEHAAAIEMAIERDLGPRVGVLVLRATELMRVVEASPLAGEGSECDVGAAAASAAPGGSTWLHATFLFTSVADADFGPATVADYAAAYEEIFGRLTLPAKDGERAVFVGVPPLAGPVVYLCLPHGYGRTKLNNAYFERTMGTAATTRNWRTVLALAEMAETTADAG
jgi:uncharacterized protein (DUF1697 family)